MAHVEACGVSVEFPIYEGRARMLRHAVIQAATGGLIGQDDARRLVVRALDDVSFVLHEGDRVGLVGHNGAGKSTLLRAMAGVYSPVAGKIQVQGRVASMLNLSLGVDYDATGYENIFVRAAIMGLERREIKRLIDDVITFSELGSYIHLPMRTYSTGMAMRLAFAVSTCVSADILLMDEWLAVGDEAFREKANLRLRRLLDRTRILVLASHDEALIRAHCNKILQLSHGRLAGIEEVP